MRLSIVLLLILFISACGSGGGSKPSPLTSSPAIVPATDPLYTGQSETCQMMNGVWQCSSADVATQCPTAYGLLINFSLSSDGTGTTTAWPGIPGLLGFVGVTSVTYKINSPINSPYTLITLTSIDGIHAEDVSIYPYNTGQVVAVFNGCAVLYTVTQ